MDTPKGADARKTMLESGSTAQIIKMMSMPTILSMVGVGVFYLVDAAFISRLGTAQLGAISVSFPLFAVVGGLGQAFGTGAASMISRLLGSGDKHKVQNIASAAFFTALLAAVIVAAGVLVFLQPLLRMAGASDTVMPYAIQYSRILVVANIITVLNITMASIVRAEGNARLSMASVLLSSGLNIVLDPVFIFAAGLGISGAAAATLAAQSASFLLLSSTFYRNRNRCRISILLWKKGAAHLPELMKIGAASFFLQILGSAALAVTNKAAQVFGDHAVAAVGLTFRFLALGMYPVFGFTVGFQPVAGYAYGARNFQRLGSALRTTVLWTLSFSLVFAGVLVGLAGPIIGIFSEDSQVIDVGTRMLRAVSLFFPLFGMQLVIAVFLQALGYGFSAALIIVGRQALFFYPMIMTLPKILGVDGVIFSQPAADILTSLLALVLALIAGKNIMKKYRRLPVRP